MKKILVIYTGGTIGMVKDKKTGALYPFDMKYLAKALIPIPPIPKKYIDFLLFIISFVCCFYYYVGYPACSQRDAHTARTHKARFPRFLCRTRIGSASLFRHSVNYLLLYGEYAPQLYAHFLRRDNSSAVIFGYQQNCTDVLWHRDSA